MNEYDRMRLCTIDITNTISAAEWRLHQEEIREQLFAEYLMRAGMIPERYVVVYTTTNFVLVYAFYSFGFQDSESFRQPKPLYWVNK